MKVAFAGFSHVHIFDVVDKLKETGHDMAEVWETDEPTIEMLKGRGITVTHRDYQTMLQETDAEIVAIGAYFGDRGYLVIEALKAGKHVVVDKPICTRRCELEEIKRLVREKNLKLGCMLSLRYMGKVKAIRELIQKGDLGEIRTIYFGLQHPLFYGKRAEWYFDDEKHGGTINDIAIHGIDTIRYISGLRPEKVLSARTWNAFAPKETGFCDSGQFMAELSGGAGLLADVSYSVPNSFGYQFPTYWEIFGTKGVVRFSWQETPTLVYLDGQTEPKVLKPKEVTQTYWDDFLTEISGGTDVVLSTEDILLSTEDTMMIQEQVQ